MNTLKSIEFDKRTRKTNAVVTLFYYTDPYGTCKHKNHCEIFRAEQIKRFILNQSAITLKFRDDSLKLAIPETMDLKPLIDLVDLVTNSGLQVVEHFSKFRNMDNFKKTDE